MSSAVTSTVTVPASVTWGDPAKVRVPGVKASQDGRSAPPERSAEYSSASESASEKLFSGNWKLKAEPAIAAWSTISFATTGASLTAVTSTVIV